MRKFKKIYVLLLAITMLIVTVSTGSINALDNFTVLGDEYFENDNVGFKLKDDVTLPSGNIKIPNVILGETRTKIPDYIFQNKNITGIVEIEDGYTDIGFYAFSDNDISAVILNSVQRVHYGGFLNNNIEVLESDYLELLDVLAFSNNKLKEVNLPKLNSIGHSAFSFNESLSHIHVDDIPINIDESAFYATGVSFDFGYLFNIIAKNVNAINLVNNQYSYVVNADPNTLTDDLLSMIKSEEDLIFSNGGYDPFDIGYSLKSNQVWHCADLYTEFSGGGLYHIYKDVSVVYVVEHGDKLLQELVFDEAPSDYLYSYDAKILAALNDILEYFNISNENKADVMWLITSNIDLVSKEHLSFSDFIDSLIDTGDYHYVIDEISEAKLEEILNYVRDYDPKDLKIDFAVFLGEDDSKTFTKQTLFTTYIAEGKGRLNHTVDLKVEKEWMHLVDGLYTILDKAPYDIEFLVYADNELLNIPVEDRTLSKDEKVLTIPNLIKYQNDGRTLIEYKVLEVESDLHDIKSEQLSNYDFKFTNYLKEEVEDSEEEKDIIDDKEDNIIIEKEVSDDNKVKKDSVNTAVAYQSSNYLKFLLLSSIGLILILKRK